MKLVDMKSINVTESIERLANEFNIEDTIIKFWADEECRDQGLSEIYIPMSNDLQGIIHEARKLIDRDGFASVEVLNRDEEGEEEVLYFYDAEYEEILA